MTDRPGDEKRNRNSQLQTAVAKSDLGLTGRREALDSPSSKSAVARSRLSATSTSPGRADAETRPRVSGATLI